MSQISVFFITYGHCGARGKAEAMKLVVAITLPFLNQSAQTWVHFEALIKGNHPISVNTRHTRESTHEEPYWLQNCANVPVKKGPYLDQK